jgi:hypothetical protein
VKAMSAGVTCAGEDEERKWECEDMWAHTHTERDRRETQMTLLAHTRAHLIVQNAIKDCGAL